MTSVNIEAISTPSDWVERSGALMAWAVTSNGRKATYIGNLSRDQTGLACECICPACGGRLQAVNAGKSLQELPVGNSLRPHFRHDKGQQQDACLVKMSQIVALQLLMQEHVIHLPAQTSRWTVGGASGQMYTGTASSGAISLRVVAREWVDEHQAKITLPNGRVVWLRLFGAYTPGLESSGDAVISIKVDDPEVSTWSAEKILEHVQLTGEWLCWEKHWEDEELAQQARLDAEQQANHWCDYIPEDLDLPAGLTHAQRSESVLHWLIKGILERSREIATPMYVETITRSMPDRTEQSRRAYLAEKSYRISNVRLEHRLKGMVPDVICTAVADGDKPFELMIEVAVTHRVDQDKTVRIRDLGIACLEIDTQKLGKGGRTTVDELRAMVLTHPTNKRWVFHPAIERQRLTAHEQLTQLHAKITHQLEDDRARSTWLQTLNDEAMLREFHGLLRQLWDGRTPKLSRGWLCQPNELSLLLDQRKFKGLDAPAIVAPRGILWMLDAIVSNAQGQSAVALFEEAMHDTGPVRLSSFVTVLGTAMVMYEAPMTSHEGARLQSMREIVKHSLGKGEATYARTSQYDQALSVLYPRIRDRLASNKGTQEVAREIRSKRLAQEQEQANKEQNAQRQAQAVSERQEELHARFNEVALYYVWLPKAGWPNDLQTTQMHVQREIGRASAVHELQWKVVLESAWQAREDGRTLLEWIQSQSGNGVRDVDLRLRLLDVAWMLEKKIPRR